MAATISFACPECGKEIHAPAEFAGKKVRCKHCTHVFRATPGTPKGVVARAPAGKAVAAPAGKPAAAPAKAVTPVAPVAPGDDDENSNPYGLSTNKEGAARCPECANEMESEDAIICLHCGYNTVTRERLALKKVHHVTGMDRFLWLLPGVACAVVVVFLLMFDILYCVLLRPGKDASLAAAFFGSGAIKMWTCIGSIFIMFFAGRFGYTRLVLHPNPPEIERH